MPIAIVTCTEFPIADQDMAFRDALRAAVRADPDAPVEDRDAPVIDIVPWTMHRVDWSRYDAAVVSTTWDYVDDRDRFFAWLDNAEAATTVLNPPEVIRRNARKRYLLDVAAAGVPSIPTTLVEQGDADADPIDIAAQHGWTDFVIKPEMGAGASGLLRVILEANPHAAPIDDQAWGGTTFDSGVTSSQTDARTHLKNLLASGDALVQPYLPGVERGEISLIYFAGACSHAVRKTPREGDIRVQHEYGGRYSRHEPTEAELAVAEAALDAENARNLPYARVDCIAGADGEPLLIELELFEPQLFTTHDQHSAQRRAEATLGALAAMR